MYFYSELKVKVLTLILFIATAFVLQSCNQEKDTILRVEYDWLKEVPDC